MRRFWLGSTLLIVHFALSESMTVTPEYEADREVREFVHNRAAAQKVAKEDATRGAADTEYAALAKLRVFLEDSKYTDLIHRFVNQDHTGIIKNPLKDNRELEPAHYKDKAGNPDPVAFKKAVENKLAAFSAKEQTLLRFFYLGQEIDLAAFKSLQPFVFERLQESKLVSISADKKKIKLNNLYVEPYQLPRDQMFLFSELPAGFQSQKEPTAFVSTTSHILLDGFLRMPASEAQEFAKGTGADFGSGIGVQAIALLKLHPEIQKMYGLEIDPPSMKLANVNAKLNRVNDRYEVQDNRAEANPLKGVQLDWAVSNPPFNIVPEAANDVVSTFGNGGSRGLDVTQIFIRQADEHLKEGGNFFFYSQLARDGEDKTYLEKYLGSDERKKAPAYQTSDERLQTIGYDYGVKTYAETLHDVMSEDRSKKVPPANVMEAGLRRAGIDNISADFVKMTKSPTASFAQSDLDRWGSQYGMAYPLGSDRSLEKHDQATRGGETETLGDGAEGGKHRIFGGMNRTLQRGGGVTIEERIGGMSNVQLMKIFGSLSPEEQSSFLQSIKGTPLEEEFRKARASLDLNIPRSRRKTVPTN